MQTVNTGSMLATTTVISVESAPARTEGRTVTVSSVGDVSNQPINTASSVVAVPSLTSSARQSQSRLLSQLREKSTSGEEAEISGENSN